MATEQEILLTNEEVIAAIKDLCFLSSLCSGDTKDRLDNAIRVLKDVAKLREQNEPVAYVYPPSELNSQPIAYSREEMEADGVDTAGYIPCYEHPAPIPEGWISVNDRLPKVGRTPILVAVSWVKYGEHEDGTPTEATGVDVTEGEYVPAHGEAGGYFDSYQGRHGDIQHITHWMPLPAPPMAARSGE